MSSATVLPFARKNPSASAGGCPRCGSTGLHACPGQPVEWTNADVARFEAALAPYENNEGCVDPDGVGGV